MLTVKTIIPTHRHHSALGPYFKVQFVGQPEAEWITLEELFLSLPEESDLTFVDVMNDHTLFIGKELNYDKD